MDRAERRLLGHSQSGLIDRAALAHHRRHFEALGRQNAERSIETLLGRLDDPRWQVRAAALKGLSFYGTERAVGALLKRVAAEDGVMQRHYFSALNRMVGTAVPAQVVAWKKWWTENKAKVLKAWS